MFLSPPPFSRYTERANLEVQLFNIQTKLRAAKQKTWYPPEGKLVSDINKVGVVIQIWHLTNTLSLNNLIVNC